MKLRIPVIILAMALLWAGSAFAGATFEKLAMPVEGSFAGFGLNHDGSRICANIGGTIYLLEEGVWLPILTGGDPQDSSAKMSADGSTIIYTALDSLGRENPALIRESEGWVPQMMEIPAGYEPCDAFRANPYSVSGDGSKVTGLLWDTCTAKVFLWTEETGMLDLGPTRGSRISDDGTMIGGFTNYFGNGTRRPAIWNLDGTTSSGPVVLHAMEDQGEVYDMTSNGSTVVGTAYPWGAPPEQTGFQAFIWQPGDTTITQLGTLSGAQSDISKATLIADNGTIYGVSGPSSTNVTPFIWTPVTGMVDLKTYLIDEGAEGLTSSTVLLWPSDVSTDGSVLIGQWADLYGGFGYYRVTYDNPSPVIETPMAGSRLTRVHPNPFNPMTTVDFALERGQDVTVAVYDLKGRKVAVLADRAFPAGDHSISWQGRDFQGRQVASGSYVVRLETAGGMDQQTVTLLK